MSEMDATKGNRVRTVIVSGPPLSPQQSKRLTAGGWSAVRLEDGDSLEDLGVELAEVEGYLLGGLERIHQRELALLPGLRIISFVGTGHAAFIDVKAAESQGVDVRNTPGLAAEAVAEHSLGLLLSLRRHIALSSREPGSYGAGPTREIASCRVGVVGLGSVGTAICRSVRPLVADVVAWNRTLRDDPPARMVGRSEVFESDVLIVALALADETRRSIGEAELRALPRGAALVNVASPEVVDPSAVAAWLSRDPEAQIAFDGYYTEPLFDPARDPHGLLAHPRVLVTPHIAAATTETWSRMVEAGIGNLEEAPDGARS